MKLLRGKMVSMLLFISVLFFLITSGPPVGFAQVVFDQNDVIFMVDELSPVVEAGNFQQGTGPALSAASALVMDANTGQVLFARKAHQPRPIASTTKIMTALVAIECGKLYRLTTVSPHAAGVEGSSIYLTAGEKLTLEELIYGALMHSGNDACVAIAENVAGREEVFVNFMNYKAHRLGARNTNFCNTNGLPHDRHLSSAYDLALITRYALKNPVFSRIVATKTHSIAGAKGKRILSNTNKMLWSYQGADGVKTGTTHAAGKCLVSSATRDGRRLIAVVLHSDDRWGESIRLLNYGFEEYANRVVAGKGEAFAAITIENGVKRSLPVTVDRDVVVTVPVNQGDKIEQNVLLEREVAAPIVPGQEVGKLEVLVEGERVAAAKLITMEGTAELPYHRLLWRQLYSKL